MDSLPNDLLSYVLSFSFRDYARISRVSHRFRFVTRQKGFWRLAALYAFKNKIPENILKEFDFFYGLEPDDPPFGWLNELFLNHLQQFATIEKRRSVYFTYYKDRVTNSSKKILQIFWWSGCDYYAFKIYTSISSFAQDSTKVARITYFKHPFLRKRIIKQGSTTYVEIWDQTKQMTWSGEPGCGEEISVNQLQLLLPKSDSFGFWIK
jgi:F-box-like